jgi:hypothetical protein
MQQKHLPDGTTILILERRDGATLQCVIDTADYPLVKQHRWYAVKDGRTYYVKTIIQEENGKINSNFGMHQLLLGPGADHRDRNGVNNRRSNLRAATTEENGGNRRKDKRAKGSSSCYKGVTVRPGVAERFEAQIRVDRKLIYLGRFNSEIEAAQAYDTASRNHFGKFAALNFPQPGEQGAFFGIDDSEETGIRD